MAIIYQIKQHVETINKGWLEVVATEEIERIAKLTYERLCAEYPDEYFELIKSESTNSCMAFTTKQDT